MICQCGESSMMVPDLNRMQSAYATRVCRWVGVVSVLLATASCRVRQEVPNPHPLVLAFRKSGCDFECPIYGLEVYSDGEVHFHGRTNTVVLGEATKHVTPSALKEIKTALTEAGFGERAGSLGVVSADDALVTVRWCGAEGCDGRTFFESDKSIPPGFLRFEAELSKILSLEEWVGRRR